MCNLIIIVCWLSYWANVKLLVLLYFFPEALVGNLFSYPFWLLEASCLPGLMAPSIFIANNCQLGLRPTAVCVTPTLVPPSSTFKKVIMGCSHG